MYKNLCEWAKPSLGTHCCGIWNGMIMGHRWTERPDASTFFITVFWFYFFFLFLFLLPFLFLLIVVVMLVINVIVVLCSCRCCLWVYCFYVFFVLYLEADIIILFRKVLARAWCFNSFSCWAYLCFSIAGKLKNSHWRALSTRHVEEKNNLCISV